MTHLEPVQFSSTYLEQKISKNLSAVCCRAFFVRWTFFGGISSDCILSEYVLEQLCRGMLQDAGRSFCGLLDYMVVSEKALEIQGICTR